MVLLSLQLWHRMATLSALLSDVLGLAEPSARFLLALFCGELEMGSLDWVAA